MEHTNGNSIIVKDITNADEIFNVLTEFRDYTFLEAIQNEEARKVYAKKLADKSNFVAAYQDNVVVGCISEYTNDSKSGCAYITFMAVKSDLGIIGSIVAMNMFIRMVDIAAARNLSTMRLEVAKDNKRAQAPPRNLGFKYVGDASPTAIYMEAPLEVARTRIKRLSAMLNRTFEIQ